jgi:anionic cell wall polymer biosynthesis LytR-Cps2A-Psr (LCP) family protein
MNYRTVLDSLGNTMETNMTFDEMVDMFWNYRNAVDDIEQVQMSGTGQMINGVYYEMIPDEEVARVSQHLKTELEID